MHGVDTVKELKQLVAKFIKYYNERRLHSVHNYQTPMNVYKSSVAEDTNRFFQFIYTQNEDEKLAA